MPAKLKQAFFLDFNFIAFGILVASHSSAVVHRLCTYNYENSWCFIL